MKKTFIHILCWFVPSRKSRRNIREWFAIQDNKTNKIFIIKDNKEYLVKKPSQLIQGLHIQIQGHNNIVKLHLPIVANNSSIIISSDCENDHIEIGPSDNINNLSIICYDGKNQTCIMGKGTGVSLNGPGKIGLHIIIHKNTGCIIGENCMFADNIDIRTTDQHTIIDKDTKAIVNNPSGNMTIGNHCWIGHNVIITKNARIPNGTIIGAGAVVSKAFIEENTAIAGNPARVIKHNLSFYG